MRFRIYLLFFFFVAEGISRIIKVYIISLLLLFLVVVIVVVSSSSSNSIMCVPIINMYINRRRVRCSAFRTQCPSERRRRGRVGGCAFPRRRRLSRPISPVRR